MLVEPLFGKASISTIVQKATSGFVHKPIKHTTGYKKIGVALEGKEIKMSKFSVVHLI
jgi:hypothetical protein